MNAQSLIAGDPVLAVVPHIVLAPAVLIESVFDVGVRVVEKLKNVFSFTLPPREMAPSTSRPRSVPTDVSEELTTDVPRDVELNASWLPMTNFLPRAISRFSDRVQYLSVLLWS